MCVRNRYCRLIVAFERVSAAGKGEERVIIYLFDESVVKLRKPFFTLQLHTLNMALSRLTYLLFTCNPRFVVGRWTDFVA